MISKKNITIEEIDKKEALRYLGYGNGQADEKIINLLGVCEKELLEAIRPKAVYNTFWLEFREQGIHLLNSKVILKGNDIRTHLEGCEKAVLLCSTLSAPADQLLRIYQVKDLSKALILEALANAATTQVCDQAEREIKANEKEYLLTWRYGIGYGDLSLDICHTFLEVLNTGKEIGVYANDSNILLPKKSVACIIGLGRDPVNKINHKTNGCLNCNLYSTCLYRKRGKRCEL